MSKKKKTPEELALIKQKKQAEKEERARKRKEREAREQAKREAELSAFLEEIGLESEEELWNKLLIENEPIDSIEIGFETEDTAYSDFLVPDRCSPASMHVTDVNGKYLLWKEGECDKHGTIDCSEFDEIQVFNTEEEALAEMETVSYGYRPIREIISEIKEDVGDPKVWIDAKQDFDGYYLNLKYDYKLLLEKYQVLDADTVRKAIARYKKFEKKFEDTDLSIYSLYKAPREWNSNQRYFVIEVGNSFCRIEKKVHIPSEMQHCSRIVCDFFTGKVFDEILEEAKRLEEETRPSREYEEARRKEKDRFKKEHGEGQIGKEVLKQLFPYLEEKLGPMLDNCDGTLRFSREFLHTMYNDEEKELSAEVYLEHHSGYCDCEVLLNVAPEEAKEDEDSGG